MSNIESLRKHMLVALEYLGTAAFAVSGVLGAMRKRMDIVGICVCGFLAAFADHAYFGALWAMGHQGQVNGVTIDLSMQYLGAGKVGPDLLAEVELLRETGRLMFLRMLITQEGEPVAASTATLRKAPKA